MATKLYIDSTPAPAPALAPVPAPVPAKISNQVTKSVHQKKLEVPIPLPKTPFTILEVGHSDTINLPAQSTVLVRINDILPLTTGNTIFTEIISVENTHLGGLNKYVTQYQIGDNNFTIEVDNLSDARSVIVSYMIIQAN